MPKGVAGKPGQKVPRSAFPRLTPPTFLRQFSDRLVRCKSCGAPLGYLPWEYRHQPWRHTDCSAALALEYLGGR